MKKIIATSALVGAATLFAGSAFAAPNVTLGGVVDFQAGFADQDSAYETGANSRETKFQNDAEIHINAEGKSDNGLVYGATVELEADVTNDEEGEGTNADKTFLYLQGNFGRVEMGANTDAAEALRVDASSIARATGGADNNDFDDFVNVAGVGSGAFILKSNLPTAHAEGATEDANKLTYYSPRFSGVQVGVSYTPDQGDVGTAAGFTGETNGDQENVFNLGLNYTGQYNEVGVAASLTGEFGEAEVAGTEDLAAYALGISASYRGFSLAGSYGDWQESNQAAGTNNDSNYWTLGAAYEQGPAGVSINYLDSEFGVAGGSNDFTNLSVGADYQLAPGLVPYVEVSFFDLDPAGATASNDGTLLLVGTELTF